MFIFLTSVNATHEDFDRIEQLIVLTAKGEKQAFSELYGSVKSSVYGFALSILKNSHDAQDVMQNCFVQIWNSAATYKEGTKPMAWILTITKNLCLMKKREQKKIIDFNDGDAVNLAAPNNTALTAENKAILNAALKVLGDDERQIVMLHVVAGLKFREIADLLDTLTATVLSKYHRAIKKMKKAVGGDDNDQ